jgi:hypothetical protein
MRRAQAPLFAAEDHEGDFTKPIPVAALRRRAHELSFQRARSLVVWAVVVFLPGPE